MKHRTGIILAYDRSTFDPVDLKLLREVAPHVDMVKVGLEAIYAELQIEGGALTAASLVRDFLQDEDEFEKPIPVMWDAKLADIGNTIAAALRNIIVYEPRFVTIHANISSPALRTAAKICLGSKTRAFGVTLLSDIDSDDCEVRYHATPAEVSLAAAKRLKDAGFTGIVCSGRELQFLRDSNVLDGMTTIVVGTRSSGVPHDDQKRVTTPQEAARLGADYVVIGREIMNAKNHVAAAKAIREELESS